MFRRACNLRLANGTLIALLAQELGDIPQGIRLETPPGFTFVDSQLAVGQRVACETGILCFVDTPLRVDLRTVRLWHSDLTALRIDMSHPQTHNAWEVAWRELLARRPGDGLATLAGRFISATLDFAASGNGSPLVKKAYPAVQALVGAAQQFSLPPAAASVHTLVGLGPGLTPSGDDFLVGFIAGLWSTSGNELLRHTYASGLGELLSRAAQRTTDISRAYLEHAAQGRVSESLLSLARAIDLGATRRAAQDVTGSALSVGSTSGADGVMGLLIGSRTWH